MDFRDTTAKNYFRPVRIRFQEILNNNMIDFGISFYFSRQCRGHSKREYYDAIRHDELYEKVKNVLLMDDDVSELDNNNTSAKKSFS